MATVADEVPTPGSPPGSAGADSSLARWIDRWVYVVMAGWFIATVLAGFVPDSLDKVAAIRHGAAPPFPIVLHVHAVLMGSWLLLLLAQTSLVATGRRDWHRQLGIAGAVLAPAMVVTGMVLVPTMFLRNWVAMQGAPPDALPGGSVEAAHNLISNLVAGQIMAGALFAIFVGWALLARRRDAGMHKRLMILATAIPLPAAIDRIIWIPSSIPDSDVSAMTYGALWIMPMFLWDLFRLGRVHRAYLAWFAIYVPAAVLVCSVWGTPGWIATVQRFMGVA